MNTKQHLLLGTRKGLVVYKKQNENWEYQATHFLGIPVTIVFADERNNNWWACLDHGHWGCKLHRSNDFGLTWTELKAPAYKEGMEIKPGVPAATRYLWSMTGGGNDYPDRLWIGTEPGGLFKSEDNGESFELVSSLWNHPSRIEHWFGAGFDYPGIHSIIVDPNDNNHIYVGISCAGVFESKDAGATWAVRNKGLIADFLPDKNAEVGHDPHLLVACKKDPKQMWQQNHCGIFKSDNAAADWQDVSQKDGPASFGFCIAVDDNDPNRAWVVPGISDVMRVAIDKKLVVSRTDDGGKTWKSFRNGLPQEACHDIVYRHGLAVSENEVAFGTTCGNLFISNDYGENWKALSNYMPMIHDVIFC